MELPLLLILFAIGASALNRNPDENAGVSKPDLFEGDVILTARQRLALKLGLDLDGGTVSRGATAYSSLLWPNGVLPYTIDSTLASYWSATNAISSVMRLWSRKTCITFKRRTTETNYVRFMKGNGCWSWVGCQGGRQDISLGSGCWNAGTVAHEITHALGFWHEQSRPDRDQYVIINRNNIRSGFEHAFYKYTSRIYSLGVPYDYGSVMHYGTHYFSKNGNATIVPRRGGVTIGQRTAPSYFDNYQMNLLYKCACRDLFTNCPWYRSNYGSFSSSRSWVRYYCKRTCYQC